MTALRIVPIVEGHGEVAAVRHLLNRIWYELLEGDALEILQPIRQPRFSLVKPDDLLRAVRLARLKLREGRRNESEGGEVSEFVLLLIDAEEDAPCLLAPRLVEMVRNEEPEVDFACVLATPEYETWFVCAAESLGGHLALPNADTIPANPETTRSKKAWLQRYFRGTYSPTVDQPRLTAAMDLALCRERCPSFDKLCRELETRSSLARSTP